MIVKPTIRTLKIIHFVYVIYLYDKMHVEGLQTMFPSKFRSQALSYISTDQT